MKNYYVILGVTSTAGFDEIKAAYRSLAKKYHPDKNQGNKTAEEKFKEIQEAYATLSNPEKRRRYDLKLNYGTSYTQPRRPASGPQYTGNAYSYAQQQAQYQARQQQQKYSYQYQQQQQQRKKPEAPDKSENYSIFVSVGIAVTLLYLIITYTAGTKEPVVKQLQHKIEEPVIEESAETGIPAGISKFDSPYINVFGDEVADSYSKNSLTLHNTGQSELIVCLVRNNAAKATIRNQYMDAGATFKMNNIPDGKYFLKVYYGNNWNPEKKFPVKQVIGGFSNNEHFVELDDRFTMQQEQDGSSVKYSSYEVDLNLSAVESEKNITAKEFFGEGK
jgi:curved DNA-binding protein CbpA